MHELSALRAAWTDSGALYTWGSTAIEHDALYQTTTADEPQRGGFKKIARPTKVEQLKDVKVVGAVGYRDELLVLPEERGAFFLCGNRTTVQKEEGDEEVQKEEGDEEESAVIPASHGSVTRFNLASGLENHKVVEAALGETKARNQVVTEIGQKGSDRRFIVLILEEAGQRSLFIVGLDGREILTEEGGKSLYLYDFLEKGTPRKPMELDARFLQSGTAQT
uniref:Uncharacterized protein n=1 Tax=Chromera velia CCMP2878 TaxID=1169474 RepID=A0A0K6SAZ7_9ALVE|eukprot:Cvel_2112.t2-p1 / transcript=Cvel_2112.t2 / gene=Cvel_2112 / organism=Chromera_velia_CCMP2878 / gene_product=hypothetical protein / transcript_product=hypothetical protein / location=Cvel_scaffold81:134490-137809(-) / protein_length=221 / sequence_SO=supercontig / SO=protein_coding / is_pseudo=false